MTAPADIVIIGGCGHVGLPLGLAFARAGKRVAALDIDAAKIDQVNAGRMPFLDRGADALLP
ncbi:MAG TPA: nucleotide sugar dehydrogenase, partial [Planctomycetota bacterium]|nr:nucleotide sugar dehydrogenase [Planctomycetota bacterium]